MGAATNDVEMVTGSPPEDFETTARRYFANPELVDPGLTAGSKLSAFTFLIRIMMTRPRDLAAWERDRGYPLIENAELAHDKEAWRLHATNFTTPERATS